MFRNLSLMRNTMAAGLLLALTGCGDGDSGGGGSLPSEADFVSGSFRDASIEGSAYPDNTITAAGSTGGQCNGATHYFETDDGRIRVYGSTALSETDFRVVATMIHQRLGTVIGKFGMDWATFVSERPVFTVDYLAELVNTYNADWRSSTLEETTDPTIVSTAAMAEETSDAAASWNEWSGLTVEEQKAFAEHRFGSLNDVLLPREALVACLVTGTGGSTIAEGSQLGIQVPGETSTYHSKVGEIFTHEIVHFVQLNIANEGQDPYQLMPRWFTEGQASFMADQAVASPDHHYNFEPVNVISFFDEDPSYGSDFTYQHYSLAYKYLHDSNSSEDIVAMMLDMKSNTDTPHQWQSKDAYANPPLTYNEGLAFSRAFAAHMEDHEGNPLTIDQYRENYHDLMNSWQ